MSDTEGDWPGVYQDAFYLPQPTGLVGRMSHSTEAQGWELTALGPRRGSLVLILRERKILNALKCSLSLKARSQP
jgi:hypothetical protein